jgi:hypothetical protein
MVEQNASTSTDTAQVDDNGVTALTPQKNDEDDDDDDDADAAAADDDDRLNKKESKRDSDDVKSMKSCGCIHGPSARRMMMMRKLLRFMHQSIRG